MKTAEILKVSEGLKWEYWLNVGLAKTKQTQNMLIPKFHFTFFLAHS